MKLSPLINNQDVFAGPLADSAIQAFTKLNTMLFLIYILYWRII